MYSFEYDKIPYSPELIACSSANMHNVPASDLIEKQLTEFKDGSIINLNGQLISASHSDDFKWNSSLSPTEKGGGTCELFYLESIRIVRE